MKRWRYKCDMTAKLRPHPEFGDCVNGGSIQLKVITHLPSRLPCGEAHYVCGWHAARMIRLLRYGCLYHEHGATATDRVTVEATAVDKVDDEGAVQYNEALDRATQTS